MSFRFDSAISNRLRKFSFRNYARPVLAVAGGLCLSLSFPNWEIAGLGWLGPGLLLASAVGCAPRAAFGLGFLGGLSFFLTSLVWLLRIPFPVGAFAGWLSLSIYCSLYPAVWVWICSRVATPGGGARPATNEGDARAEDRGPRSFLAAVAGLSWSGRAFWCLFCAALWVALEMLRVRFLTGFPWNILGASQFRMLPVIQMAAWTGVYGVSFLMVWFSASFRSAVAVLLVDPARHRSWVAEMILPMLVVAVATAMGFDRVSTAANREAADSSGPKLRVAFVQPSIPQTVIFDPSEAQPRFQKLLAMSTTSLAQHPDVVIWPEGAMPPWTVENFRAITNFTASHHVWMIFGADDVEQSAKGVRYFNSAVLFGPDGTFANSYRKRLLVIFGEYIPLIRWLPFLRYLTPIEDGFSAGDRPGDFRLSSLRARIGVFICFEDVFPDDTRAFVRSDTDFLLNLTNDGWFGESAAQWQQAGMSVFRAVENGAPLARCTNNGLTCWIDKVGRIRQWLEDGRNIYSPGIMVADLPLLGGAERTPTFYHQHGDCFGWVCVVWVCMQLARRISARRGR